MCLKSENLGPNLVSSIRHLNYAESEWCSTFIMAVTRVTSGSTARTATIEFVDPGADTADSAHCSTHQPDINIECYTSKQRRFSYR